MISENGGNGNGMVVRNSAGGRGEHVVARPLTPPPRQPEQPGGGLPIAAILNGLRRSWFIAVPIGLLLCVAGALAGWKLMVPKYTASAYVQVNSSGERLVFETADNAPGNANSFKLFKSTQQQLLLTPFVLNTAMRAEGIGSLPEVRAQVDPVGWLQEEVKITFPADGEIMKVSLETASPTSCVKLVNAVVDAYMTEVVMSEREERLKRLDNLERVHAEAESKVRNKRTELKSLASALGTGDTDSLTVAQQSALQQFGLMQEKLSNVQFQLMQAEGEMKIANELAAKYAQATAQLSALATQGTEASAAAAPSSPAETFDLSKVERPAHLVRLESEISDMRTRLSGMTDVGAGHPSVRRLTSELSAKQTLFKRFSDEFEQQAREDFRKRQQLSILPANVAVGGSSSSRPLPFGEYELASMASRVAVLKSQEKMLVDKVEELSAETRQLGKSSIDVELMRGEIAGLEEVLTRVGEEIEKTGIELKTSSRVKLLSSAENATPPDPKKRLALTIGLAFVGLLLPAIALVGWDLSRKRVSDVDSAKSTLELANLGSIPRVQGDPLDLAHSGKRTVRRNRELHQLKESIDGLAAMLLYRSHEMGQQAFMLTSATSGEGKSTVACQVANSLARCGKRVVLVDLDLRRPTIHTYLKLDKSPGISELLLGRVTLSEAVQTVVKSGLEVLTSGAAGVRVQEQASSGALDSVFDELRSRYDIIIVDACPVLPVVDAKIVGKFVDGTIMTLVRDVSILPNSMQAYKMLQSFGVKVIGTVFIGSMPRSYSNYYYYGSNEEQEPMIAAAPSKSGSGK